MWLEAKAVGAENQNKPKFFASQSQLATQFYSSTIPSYLQ